MKESKYRFDVQRKCQVVRYLPPVGGKNSPQNSVVIIAGDHGESLGKRGTYRHGKYPHAEEMQPLIIDDLEPVLYRKSLTIRWRNTTGPNATQSFTLVINQAPTVNTAGLGTTQNTAVQVSVAKLLAYASDADGDTLTVIGASATSMCRAAW